MGGSTHLGAMSGVAVWGSPRCARTPPRRILARMKPTTVVLGLSLDERETLTGWITSRGARVPFRGWIGLIAALDRLLAEAQVAGAALPAGDDHAEKGDLP